MPELIGICVGAGAAVVYSPQDVEHPGEAGLPRTANGSQGNWLSSPGHIDEGERNERAHHNAKSQHADDESYLAAPQKGVVMHQMRAG
jgi:hypothetical protein